jgi:hypothetical protein
MNDDILDILIAHGVPGSVIVRVAKLIAESQVNESRKTRNRERMQTVRARARTQVHTETQETECVSKKERKKGSKKHTLPENWSLSEQDRAYARAKGWVSDQINTEGERFRLYYVTKGTLITDDHLCWCKWVMSPYRHNGKRGRGNDDGADRRAGKKAHSISATFDDIFDRIERGDEPGLVSFKAHPRLLPDR